MVVGEEELMPGDIAVINNDPLSSLHLKEDLKSHSAPVVVRSKHRSSSKHSTTSSPHKQQQKQPILECDSSKSHRSRKSRSSSSSSTHRSRSSRSSHTDPSSSYVVIDESTVVVMQPTATTDKVAFVASLSTPTIVHQSSNECDLMIDSSTKRKACKSSSKNSSNNNNNNNSGTTKKKKKRSTSSSSAPESSLDMTVAPSSSSSNSSSSSGSRRRHGSSHRARSKSSGSNSSSSSSSSSSGSITRRRRRRDDVDELLDGIHFDDMDYIGGAFQDSMSEGEDYTCLTEADIIAEQSREIADVSEVLSIPQSASIVLLRHFKWKKERLFLAYFENPQRVLSESGVSLSVMESSNAAAHQHSTAASTAASSAFEDDFTECSICCDDLTPDGSFALDSCRHRFCNACWEQHLSTQISEGNAATLKCPHSGCQTLVNESAVRRLVPDAVYRRYCTFLMQSFVNDNDNVKWCPAPGCGNAITIDMVENLTVTCKCGYRFCFHCNESAHLPASCHQMKVWRTKCQDESETKHWIAANTKECPKCDLPTEKNGGCNHMTCRHCKYEYCWVCLKDWKGHNDYYTCNRYQGKESKDGKPVKDKDREKKTRSKRKQDELRRLEMKAALEKYLHYYSRFQNHSHSSELELVREKAMLRMQEMQATEATAAEVRFIKDATDQLLECRNVLKHSYVIGYYLEDEASKSLFEYLQEDLEKTVEQLSEALEMQEKARLSDIMRDKVKVINVTKLANIRLNNFLTAVCNPRFQDIPPPSV